MTPNLNEELTTLRELYRRGESVLDALSAPFGSGESWDAAQHMHHLILVNASVTRLIPALAAGKFAEKSAAAKPELLEKLYAGYFPSGGTAPTNVEPSVELDKDELLSAWREGFKKIEALEGQDLESDYRLEHQFYGPLTALEWLKFMGIHTRHHLNLIETLS